MGRNSFPQNAKTTPTVTLREGGGATATVPTVATSLMVALHYGLFEENKHALLIVPAADWNDFGTFDAGECSL
jgi:hypothetical protein